MEYEKIVGYTTYLVEIKKWSPEDNLAEIHVEAVNEFGIKFKICTNHSDGFGKYIWSKPDEFSKNYKILTTL